MTDKRSILLDHDMRIKVTDFGSATIIKQDQAGNDDKEGKDAAAATGKEGEGKKEPKRSFVGTADFVSPEVLRNEPAVYA